MMNNWLSFLQDDVWAVVDFFRDIFSVFPQPFILFLFLFPAFSIVVGATKAFRHIFGE